MIFYVEQLLIEINSEKNPIVEARSVDWVTGWISAGDRQRRQMMKGKLQANIRPRRTDRFLCFSYICCCCRKDRAASFRLLLTHEYAHQWYSPASAISGQQKVSALHLLSSSAAQGFLSLKLCRLSLPSFSSSSSSHISDLHYGLKVLPNQAFVPIPWLS